jgi:hypothetical protein
VTIVSKVLRFFIKNFGVFLLDFSNIFLKQVIFIDISLKDSKMLYHYDVITVSVLKSSISEKLELQVLKN